MILFAETALLPRGWARDVRIRLEAGRIVEVTEAAARGGEVHGCLLPAPVNLHSHTFQRAMAGLTEARTAGQDSFWTWRALMYRFLDRLSPDDVEAIAAQAMVEMAEAGFSAVAEFHYLHHPAGGGSYADLAEMSARVAAAAGTAGLGLTLLPVLYQQGGVDGRALAGGQLRFGSDLDEFARLLEGAGRAIASQTDAVLGVAPHSLRAVAREALVPLAGMVAGPVHMHLAEQEAEVTAIQSAWGARPVEWAVANLPLDRRWCLIHATQMTGVETAALARTGAVAGLCPITEANLGDGVFDATGWRAAGGAFGVGTDSNIRISLAEELRVLEYSQRLTQKARAVLAEDERSTGRVLWQEAAKGGAQASGRGTGAIELGAWADLMAPDTGDLRLDGLAGDQLLDAFIFAGRDGLVRDLWSAGRHIVKDGRHIARDAVATRFRTTMRRLRASL
ncbi:MAG: formimidoylglutamate deiminase [Rhodobacterales bacterium 12-65-15]|nr:MAG: formimidoylglutamate deiminase [Rhodobacterales bacterium 12-65-15]